MKGTLIKHGFEIKTFKWYRTLSNANKCVRFPHIEIQWFSEGSSLQYLPSIPIGKFNCFENNKILVVHNLIKFHLC